MQNYQKQVYKTKQWQTVRQLVIDRDRSICYFCGRIVTKKATVHHLQEINEQNFNDWDIAFNMDNLVCCHPRCHDLWHERFGYKNSIVNDDLTIDYSKRERRYA